MGGCVNAWGFVCMRWVVHCGIGMGSSGVADTCTGCPSPASPRPDCAQAPCVPTTPDPPARRGRFAFGLAAMILKSDPTFPALLAPLSRAMARAGGCATRAATRAGSGSGASTGTGALATLATTAATLTEPAGSCPLASAVPPLCPSSCAYFLLLELRLQPRCKARAALPLICIRTGTGCAGACCGA